MMVVLPFAVSTAAFVAAMRSSSVIEKNSPLLRVPALNLANARGVYIFVRLTARNRFRGTGCIRRYL